VAAPVSAALQLFSLPKRELALPSPAAAPTRFPKSHSVSRALDNTLARYGRLDVVVNSAGAVIAANAESTSDAEWHRLIAVNLTGTFFVCRAAIPHLRRAGGGSIINIGSVYGLVGNDLRAAYAAAKGGVTTLTRALAVDHGPEKIRVNCICPALVETDLARIIMDAAPDPAAARSARMSKIPLGRFGSPADVARLALFLASDESSWMTGSALPLDGGYTAH
jgi:NAD(P)-dependent dehydrogenase (short-subunit alcohol dehydrogenase family)